MPAETNRGGSCPPPLAEDLTAAISVRDWTQHPAVLAVAPEFRQVPAASASATGVRNWTLLTPDRWLYASGIGRTDFDVFQDELMADPEFSALHLAMRLDEVADVVPDMPLWCALGWVIAFFHKDGPETLNQILLRWGGDIDPHAGFVYLLAGMDHVEMRALHEAGTLPDRRTAAAMAILRDAPLPRGVHRLYAGQA